MLALVVFAVWTYFGVQLVEQLEVDGMVAGIVDRVLLTTNVEKSADDIVSKPGAEYGSGGEPSPPAEEEVVASGTEQVEQSPPSEPSPPTKEPSPPTNDGVTREAPVEVVAGQVFQVIVLFTAPVDGFNSIGLADVAPAGWDVSLDETWCTPSASFAKTPDKTTAEYVWMASYDPGQVFTLAYKIQVPIDASPGTYTFGHGWMEYYLGSAGPYKADITGHAQVTVIKE